MPTRDWSRNAGMSTRWFGNAKGKQPTASTPADADVLRQIADSKDLIDKRQAHLTRKAGEATQEAIAHKSAGRKEQALACLKRKKLIDDELAGLIQQLVKLDTQEHTLQSLHFNETTLAVEQAATAAIKKKLVDVGGVERIQEHREQTEETLEDAFELLGVASEPTAIPGLRGQDDDELWAELEEMAAEEDRALTDQLLSVNVPLEAGSSSVAFPRPPERSSLKEEEARELAELDRLAASMRVEKPMPMPMSALPCAMTVQVA